MNEELITSPQNPKVKRRWTLTVGQDGSIQVR